MYDWDQFDDPKSRFTNQPVFVVHLPELAGHDVLTDEEMASVAAEARGEGETAIRPFQAVFGRGAAGTALGLLVDLAIGVGGSAAWSTVTAVWKRIRHRRPTMSVGALRYLCMADLAHRLGRDSLDDVLTVLACDTSGPRPTELNMVDIEPVLVVFADKGNTRSWVYLVSPRGHVLSFHEGEPMIGGLTYYKGLPQPSKEPPLLLPDD